MKSEGCEGMTNNQNQLLDTEFTQSYEFTRHYHNIHYQMFRTYITVYLAIWGGYFFVMDAKLPDFGNYLLAIGVCAGVLMSLVLISNRFYFVMMLKRLEFFRRHFVFKSDAPWEDYPQFYKKKVEGESFPTEGNQMIKLTSTFALTLLLMCCANAMLFYKINLKDSCQWGTENQGWATLLVLVALLIICALFAYDRQRKLNKYAGIDKESVERK